MGSITRSSRARFDRCSPTSSSGNPPARLAHELSQDDQTASPESLLLGDQFCGEELDGNVERVFAGARDEPLFEVFKGSNQVDFCNLIPGVAQPWSEVRIA